jgi:hypothetical protein
VLVVTRDDGNLMHACGPLIMTAELALITRALLLSRA